MCNSLQFLLLSRSCTNWKQAGNGPSRRRIQGSKIAKGLQISKYWWLGNTFMNFFFRKKSHNAGKNEREDPFLRNFFLKKVAQCRKNLKKGPFGLVRYCILCGKPFWFSSLGHQVYFGVFCKFCRIFSRTILVSSGLFWSHRRKKTLTKINDYSRLFS